MKVGGEIHFGWQDGLEAEMLLLHPPGKAIVVLTAA